MKEVCTWSVIKESISFTMSHLTTLGKILVVPLSLQIGFFILQNSVFNMEPVSLSNLSSAINSSQNIVFMILNILVISLAISLSAPRWIQFYHSTKKAVSWFAFHKSQWKFFLYSLFFIGIFLVGLFLVPYVTDFVISLGLPAEYGAFVIPVGALVSALLMIRLAFLWPALALSKSTDFKQAWEQTSCCYGKLLYLAVVLVVLISPAAWLSYGGMVNSTIAVVLMVYSTLVGAVGGIAVTKLYLNKGNR